MFTRNRAKLILSLAAITDTLLDNYWLFTDIPLDDDHKNEIAAKVFYTIGEALTVLALWGYGVGSLLDKSRVDKDDLWLHDSNSSERRHFGLSAGSFFSKNKAQLLTGGLGVAKALMDNYWLFTRIPLAGEKGSDPIAKSLLAVGQCVVNALLWGAVGRIIDYHRESQRNVGERSSLLNTRVASISLQTSVNN